MRLELSPIPPGERRGKLNNYRLGFVDEGYRAITLHAAGFWENHRVVLLDARGEEPPLTERGRALRDALTKGYRKRDHDLPRTLVSGETLIETAWIDLDAMYRLSPGRYTLTVEYYEQVGDPLRILSNAVEVVEGPNAKP